MTNPFDIIRENPFGDGVEENFTGGNDSFINVGPITTVSSNAFVALRSTEGGSVRVEDGSTSGPRGRRITLVATPEPGYVFDGFSVETVTPRVDCSTIVCPQDARCVQLSSGEYGCVKRVTNIAPTPTPTVPLPTVSVPIITGGGTSFTPCNNDFDCYPNGIQRPDIICLNGQCVRTTPVEAT